MKDLLTTYIKRVADLADHVRGNEQATKQSLIAPLFTMLGYDLTDPRECMPEYRADFGQGRSVKPVDWAFMLNGRPAFFVEAKEVGKKLPGYDEQLADYFAKSVDVKLGILTNGVQWRFFTDIVAPNVMDKEPFARWDVLTDEEPPHDFLTLLQKSQFNPQLIRTFAERTRAQNLLVSELTRLLEPAAEFVKLAIANIETRNLTAPVVETWKPIVAGAIESWAKQRTLSSVLSTPAATAAAGSNSTDHGGAGVVTTQDELDTFAAVCNALGASRAVAYQDTQSYFKIHLVERQTWVVCRLYFGKRKAKLWVPLNQDVVQPMLAGGTEVYTPEPGWTAVGITGPESVPALAEVLRLAWDSQREAHPVEVA